MKPENPAYDMPVQDPALVKIASDVVQRYAALRRHREPHEYEWEEIARWMYPSRRGMTRGTPPRDRMRGIHTSEPLSALRTHANELYNITTNPAVKWAMGRPKNVALRDDPEARRYAEFIVGERLLPSFDAGMSSYYGNARSFFRDYAAFGNGVMYDELDAKRPFITDYTVPLGEIVIATDPDGRVVEAIRHYRLTAPQAMKLFPAPLLPAGLRRAYDRGLPDRFTFYHSVRERAESETRGHPFVSVFVAEDERRVVRQGGYYTMPYGHAAYDTDPGDIWGRGPGFIALPSARLLNHIEAAILTAGQRAANPTLLAANERAFKRGVRTAPGDILYGGLNGGRAQVAPLQLGGAIGLTLDMARQRSEEMDIAFNTVSTRLAARTGITPQEALERQQERLQSQGPNLGTLQSRFIGPKLARRFDMLSRAGQMPDPPPGFEGEEIEILYTSSTAQAQKASEGIAVMNLAQSIGQIEQLKPGGGAKERLSVDDALDVLQGAYGAPARTLVAPEVAEAMRAQEAEQVAQAQGLAQAGQAAGIARDLASAIPAENA